MYSEKFFNIYFHEQFFFFFLIFVAKEKTGQFFEKIIASEQYNFH